MMFCRFWVAMRMKLELRLFFVLMASAAIAVAASPAKEEGRLSEVRSNAVERAKDVLRKRTVPQGMYGLKAPFVMPGGYMKCWWQLDSTSALEGVKWFDFPFAERSILDFANVQKPDGRPLSPDVPFAKAAVSSSCQPVGKALFDVGTGLVNCKSARIKDAAEIKASGRR